MEKVKETDKETRARENEIKKREGRESVKERDAPLC